MHKSDSGILDHMAGECFFWEIWMTRGNRMGEPRGKEYSGLLVWRALGKDKLGAFKKQENDW